MATALMRVGMPGRIMDPHQAISLLGVLHFHSKDILYVK